MNNKMTVLLLAFLIVFLFPLTLAAETAGEVHVSIYPIYELADRIGGEYLDIKQVVPDGVEPHGYEPSPRTIAGLERAKAFIYIGQGLEPWGERGAEIVSEQQGEVIKLTDHVDLIPYRGFYYEGEGAEEEENHDHDHGHEHDHDHGDYDNHIWLDFNNMEIIAEVLTDLFIELEPTREEEMLANKERVQNKLAELDQAFREGLKDLEQDTIIVSHAAFGYLAENYDLQQVAVTGLSPEEEPSSRVVADLIEIARESGVEYIFLETLASPRTVDVIAEEADLGVLTLNPVEGLREEDIERGADYFSIMYENLENLKKGLGKN